MRSLNKGGIFEKIGNGQIDLINHILWNILNKKEVY